MCCILAVKVFFCSSKSYLMQDNLHLKYIFFNEQQYIGAE